MTSLLLCYYSSAPYTSEGGIIASAFSHLGHFSILVYNFRLG